MNPTKLKASVDHLAELQQRFDAFAKAERLSVVPLAPGESGRGLTEFEPVVIGGELLEAVKHTVCEVLNRQIGQVEAEVRAIVNGTSLPEPETREVFRDYEGNAKPEIGLSPEVTLEQVAERSQRGDIDVLLAAGSARPPDVTACVSDPPMERETLLAYGRSATWHPNLRDAVERHLIECPFCRDVLAEQDGETDVA